MTMKSRIALLLTGLTFALFHQCTHNKAGDDASAGVQYPPQRAGAHGGFASQVAWGEHLAIIGACHDCHTPRKMSPAGPVLDSARWLSGHPAQMPGIEVDRAAMEGRGYVVTWDLTGWIGPRGVTYTANLTPDPTCIGNRTEEQFFKTLREGKYKGLDGFRPILPHKPWEMYRNMTDDEIRAVFANLKSIPPVDNPVSLPPVLAVN